MISWDHLGRMTHAEVNNGGVTKSVAYANNPAGKRFMRVAGGVTKAWTYQGDNIASVESTTSPTLHSVYSGSGLGGVAERHDVDTAGGGSTTSRFYLYNHRGDVVGVSDASGNLTSAYDYDAYGAVSQSAQSGGGSAPTDDILFTGKDLDPDTGLYYFNARWYDSESGRFVSRTPLRADYENEYAFCEDNAIGFTDSTGLAVDNTKGTTTVYCKSEEDNKVFTVAPGENYSGKQDGLVEPATGNVIKTVDGDDVTVGKDGKVGDIAWPLSGAVDQQWLDKRHKANDYGWDPIFKKGDEIKAKKKADGPKPPSASPSPSPANK